MENFVAFNPTKVHFGRGTVNSLGKAAAELGNHALLVYGGGSVLKNGSYDDTLAQLENTGLSITETHGIKPNPTIEMVDEAVRTGSEAGVDLVVAIGGGSVIDAAKIIAVCLADMSAAWDVMKGKIKNPRALPLIAVLTLAATGTEMNAIAVVQNNQTREKFGYANDIMFPRHSFLDPTYTCSVPADYTAYGVIDLVAHAVEPFFGAGDASLSDRFVAAIIREAMLYGPQLMENLGDYTLRARIMWAATTALNGLTLFGRSNGDFASHALGHQLSLLYDTAHGASLSITLPAWLKHMKSRLGDRIGQLGKLLFDNPDVDQTIQGLEDFFVQMGCPVRCQEIGLNESHIKEITALANKNKCDSKNPDNHLDDRDRISIVELMFAT
jgi:alcohol dehydrogenase YqhD (iron-dependent ADH family)